MRSEHDRSASAQRAWVCWVATPGGVLLFLAGWLLLAVGLWSGGTVTVAMLVLVVACWVSSIVLLRLAASEVKRVRDSHAIGPSVDGVGGDAAVMTGAGGIGTAARVSSPLARISIGGDRLVIASRGGRLAQLFGGFGSICVERSEVRSVRLSSRGRVTFDAVDGRLGCVWFTGDAASLAEAFMSNRWPLTTGAAS